jgi:hypothetical protein
MCIQNDQGIFIRARTMWFNRIPSLGEAEAKAWKLKEVITWLRELVLIQVVIELDCLLVIKAIQDSFNDQFEFDNTIKECECLLRNYPNFKGINLRSVENIAISLEIGILRYGA